MMRRGFKAISLLLALTLLASLAAPAMAAETAAAIRLQKTQGTVSVSKSSGKGLTLLNNMRLYNGYHVTTDAESYAWINLDDTKLIKQDASSEVEVRKNGKNLEVNLWSGNLFFDVAEELKSDETLKISTSTMVVGIRGTSGWLNVTDRWRAELHVLEGEVECSVSDPVTGQEKTESVVGGETVTCVVYSQDQEGDKCDILRTKYTEEEIPGFVLTDLVEDEALCEKIKEGSGLDVLGVTPEEAQQRLEEDEAALGEKLAEMEKELEKQPGKTASDKALPTIPAETPVVNESLADRDDDRDDSSSGSGSGSTSTPDPAPPTPGIYTVTFDLNGGTGSSAPLTTGEDGKLASWPGDPATTKVGPNRGTPYIFDGWYTAAEGGTKVASSYVFSADTTLYAHWKLDGWDWELAAGTLTIMGTGAMDDYEVINTTYTMPWHGEPIRTVVVEDGITHIGNYAFSYCEDLTSITVPASVTSIGTRAFWWTDSLTTINYDGTKAQWTALETPVDPGLSSEVTITCTDGTIGNDGTYIVVFYCRLDVAPWPDGSTARTVRTSADGTVTLPPTPIADGYVFIEWNFGGDGGDTINEETVFTEDSAAYLWLEEKRIDWELDEATGELTIRGWGPMDDYESYYGGTSATEGNTYSNAPWAGEINAPKVKNITIDYGVTSIGRNAFCFCINATSISLPSTVTSIGYGAFMQCTSLQSINLDGITSIGNMAFSECYGLTAVALPEGLTSVGNYVFSNCTGLISVTLPSTLNSIEDGAFARCTGLTSLTVPEGVVKIGGAAFENCTNLTAMYIPASVTDLASGAFAGSGLTDIYYGGTQAQWDTLAANLAVNPNPTVHVEASGIGG